MHAHINLYFVLENFLNLMYTYHIMDIHTRYDTSYPISASNIDTACRMKPLYITQIAQDLAAAHYGRNGLSIPHLAQKGFTWIIAKQRFEISEYPLWLDDIAVSTWAKEPKGPFCFRDYEFSYTATGRRFAEPKNEPIIRATSNWLLMDLKTGKPIKPSPEFMGTLLAHAVDSLPSVFPKIPLSDTWDESFSVLPSKMDIDLNNHVNNINYIRWFLESVPDQVSQTSLISTLDTYFISSAMRAENLISRTAITAVETVKSGYEYTCVHSIIREKDTSEVFRAQTHWKPISVMAREHVLD